MGPDSITSTSTYRPTCSTLKYVTFIKVQVSKNYSLVGGKSNWDEIEQEYSSLIKTDKTNNLFEAWRRLEWAEARFKFINKAIPHLKLFYDQDIALVCVEYGFDYLDYDPLDVPGYEKQIGMLEAEARTLVVIISQLRQEYERLAPSPDKIKVRTELDYEEELAAISQQQGYYVNKNEVTVLEVCAMINYIMKKNKKK